MTWQEQAEKHPAWPFFVTTILDATWFASLLPDIWDVYRMGWEDREKLIPDVYRMGWEDRERLIPSSEEACQRRLLGGEAVLPEEQK